MPVPAHLRTCPCGRECKSRSGLATHAAACRTAQAATAAYCRAIEGGQHGDRVLLARSRAIALAEQHPAFTLAQIAEEAAQFSARATIAPRCWCGRRPATASPFCTEHDDPPARP